MSSVTTVSPNKPLLNARAVTGMTQKAAASVMGVSPALFSKYERGTQKPDQRSLMRYFTGIEESSSHAVVHSKKGAPKGLIGNKTITAVRALKDEPNAVVVTSRFKTPGRKDCASQEVSWSVRVYRSASPGAFRLAKGWRKPIKK